MKTVFSVLGMLTAAQWVFVGLLYLFIQVQGKASPETWSKLHSLPVVGGYFPDAEVPDAEDLERDHRDAMRIELLEAKRDYELPPAFSPEEFEALLRDLETQREDLASRAQLVESRETEVRTLVEDLEQRERRVAAEQAALAEKAREVELKEQELMVQVRRSESEGSERVETNLRRLAKIVAAMKPDRARELLVGEIEALPEAEERESRYRDAARLLAYVPAETSSAIMENMSHVEFVRIKELMKEMPVSEK